MIHAFSLVHDDLPALDNDDLRRGRATLHKAKGEAMAILAGDALQSFAIEMAFASPVAPNEIARAVLRAVATMIDGQVLDTLDIPIEGSDPESTLQAIHHRKTGALLECSCYVGGLAARADAAALEALGRYGRAIGLMFQIVDDLLDESQSTEHLGKTAGKDAELGQMTFISVLGEQASRLRVIELESEAIAAASEFGALGEDLSKFAKSLAVRTR
jgi:geranylgeranyl pyrophosphate synthase